MFWGVILESGKRYSQKVSESYHLSMACLEALPGNTKPAKKEVYVMVEHGETEYILCVLEYGRVMQEKLDIIFDCGEVVTYFLNGEGVVHLTGYALADTKDENEVLEKTVIAAALKAGEEEDDDEEDDEDWTPSKAQQRDSDSSEESKDEESESESEPALVQRDDKMEQDQLNESSEDESDDNRGKRKKASGKSIKSKKRKISESSPTQNGHLKEEEVKIEKRKKIEANHVNAEDSEDASDSESGESPDDDDGIDDEDSEDDSSDEEQGVSSAGRTPKPKKIARGPSRGESTDVSVTQSKSQKQQKNKLKTQDVSSTNKGTVPVTTKTAKKLTGNVQIEDLRTGKGPRAKSGKLVFFHYVGKFPSGKSFEKCEDPDEPFSFRLGRGEVIKGLDIGLEGMSVGGKRRITVPPHMGYGLKGVDGIPPNSTLIFTVELKAVK